ncbi:diiron oxygenase [Nocardia inohanensis]|uniref:diiron oxygenase n=1 Tax=Nocardia inohanensis TaxID=209246 RepID=UPI00082BB5CF|nr:diiron oxygenase [Nocardia inohanensis]
MPDATDFTRWTMEFEAKARARRSTGDPDWTRPATLHPDLIRSIQRFQVGEDGDGANLVSKADAAGDPTYAAAARLFIAEEQNHARLLEQLLNSAGAQTISSHWTDAVFVRLRRALGLRLELMTLSVAEVIAVRYYRALRDGTADPLTTQVASLILEDERRHVPFHIQRLRQSFTAASRPTRTLAALTWWLVFAGATIVVTLDHGPALRQLGITRTRFIRDAIALFRGTVRASITGTRSSAPQTPARRGAESYCGVDGLARAGGWGDGCSAD